MKNTFILPSLLLFSALGPKALAAQVNDDFHANVTYGKTDLACDFSMHYTANICLVDGENPCTVNGKTSKVHCTGMTKKKTKINNYEIISDTGVAYIASFTVSKKGQGKFSRCICDHCTHQTTTTTTTVPVPVGCCHYKTSSGMQCIQTGETIVWAEKCLYIRCLSEGMRTLEIEAAFDGCNCCLGPDKKTLYEDDAVITLPSGVNATCCEGKWVNVLDVSEPTCDWTDWDNKDHPSATGDYEKASKECTESGIVKYEVRLVTGGQVYKDVADITQNILHYNAVTGEIFCINANQVGCKVFSNGWPIGWPILPPCCQDYETRFCCKPPEIEPPCKWSKWTDLDNPSATGDYEKPGPECGKYGVKKYEVTDVNGGQIFTDVNDIFLNTVVFNQETGDISCVNNQQNGCETNSIGWPVGWPVKLPCCLDYKARYCCEPQKTVDTIINIVENGETIVQTNSYSIITGILEMNVPQHGDLTRSTYILGPDTNLLQTNNSCHLSPLPADYNLTEAAAALSANGANIADDENVYFIIKARESRVGVEERKTLLYQAQSHCSNQPITRTRDIRVSKEDFESGDVIFVNRNGGNSNARGCDTEWEVCSTGGPAACGRGWANPNPPYNYFTFHQVSGIAICVNCTYTTPGPGPGCNVDPFKKYCLCEDILNKEDLQKCKVQDDIVVDIKEGDELFSQRNTFSSVHDRLAVTVDSPAHNNLTAMKVIMNAANNGYWHEVQSHGVYLQNNRMMKINNKCHVDTLPAGHFPIDMAVGMQEIAASNKPITAEDEVTIHSMLTNDGPINSSNLHELVKEECKNSTTFKSKEEYISKEESDHLRNGGVVFRNSSQSTRGFCLKLTANTMLTPRSCWRWPNPVTGENISVHNIVYSAVSLSCYNDTKINNIPCPTDYCLCSDITNKVTFLDCLVYPGQPDIIMVLSGTQNGVISANMTLIEKIDNSLFPYDQLNTNLPPSTNSIGAVFRGTKAMEATVFFCAGYIEGPEAPSQCYMYSKGAGFSPIFSLETNLIYARGASVVFTTDEGDYWWIIGEDWNGDTTSVYFNLTRNYNLPQNSPPTLPIALNAPCITKVNNTFAFVTGVPMNEPATTNLAWLYDFFNDAWIQLPNTLKKRVGASCGCVDTVEGQYVVLAGGLYEDTSENININNPISWEEGPQLPPTSSGYYGGQMVKIENELVLVGGYSVESNLQGIQPVSLNGVFLGFSEWTDMGQIPEIYSPVALFVPRKLVKDLLPPPTPCGPPECGLYCTLSQECQPTAVYCWQCVG